MANEITVKVLADVDDAEVQALQSKIDGIDGKTVQDYVDVDDEELDAAKEKEESLNDTATVSIDVDDGAIQTAMQNINDGLNQTKQGLSEVAGAFSEIQQAGVQSEQNKAFLEMNLGAEKAKQTYQDISDIVASMPGDDNTMRSVLSTAQALGNNLKPDEMKDATKTMADYMAGSATMGKQAIESQQDIMKYLLDGNTAELERGSIVSSQVDKLKEATTFMERQEAMQKVLNELGYGGISQADTMINKQAEWEGMLYNSSDALSSMWLGAEAGMMDFMLGLNDVTGGMAGMALVATQQFGPALFSTAQGITTMVPGVKALVAGYGGLGGAVSSLGSGLISLATGPVGIIIAALIALGIAVYEVGKYFGWWSDVGGMFDAIKTGVLSLWEAFTSNEYVIQVIDLIKQGLTDAWNALSGFVNFIMSNLTGASGEFDILSWAINTLQTTLNTVGPVVVWFISTMISNFRTAYSIARVVFTGISIIVSTVFSVINSIVGAGRGVWSGIIGVWNQAKSIMSGFGGAVSSGLSVAGAAWNSFKSTVMGVVQPILDKIKALQDAASSVGDFIFGGGSGGVESYSSTGYGGAGGNIFNITINGNIDSDARINQLKEDFARIVDGEVKENEMVIG